MESIQLSMFSIMEDSLLTKAAKNGSGFEGGKQRIYNASRTMTENDLIDYVKKEYGIGGYACQGIYANINSKGIFIGFGFDNMEHYSWKEVTKEILKLIDIGEYLDD